MPKAQISGVHSESYFGLLIPSKVLPKMRTGDLNFELFGFIRINSKVQIRRPHSESRFCLLASSKA